MKIINLFIFLGLLLTFHAGAMKTLGQGVCVIAEQKVEKIAGNVKFLNSESFVNDAKMKLTQRSDKTEVLKETTTNEKGWFEFKEVNEGKYWLIISSPNLKSLYIPVKVSNKKKDVILQISLGALIDDPCGGGDVKTVSP